MGTRRPFDPFTPLSPNLIGTRYSASKVSAVIDDRMSVSEHLPDNGSLSGSSSSRYGALDEEDTEDSFARRMIREMNQERAQSTRSGRPQAFRKARTKPGVGLTLENLERIAPSNNIIPQAPSYSSPGSVSSGHSEPPLNVPREWGRKGRRNNDWLRRITMDTPVQIPKAVVGVDVDWAAAAADVPIPSVEDSPSSRKGSTRGTPASTVRRQHGSLERVREWELSEELTMDNLVASTPAVVPRNTALHDLRQRELETALEESIYPTPPRDGLSQKGREHGTSSISRMVTSSASPKRQATGSLTDTWTHPAEQDIQIPKRAERTRIPTATSTSGIGDGGPPSPIAVSKSSHTVGIIDRAVTPQVQKSPQRPAHHREDSQDILRRLARASSGTPSPGRILKNPPTSLPSQSRMAPAVKEGLEGVSTKARAPDDTDGQDRSITANAEQSQTKSSVRDKAAGGNARVGKLGSQRGKEDQTAAPSSPPRHLEPKTPTVTGAWVDTPARPSVLDDSIRISPKKTPAKKAAAAALQRAAEAAPEVKSSQPKEPLLPSSALSAVVGEARLGLGQDNGDAYGEATIESLEDIMSPHGEYNAADVDEDTLDDLQVPTSKPRNAAEKQRLAELVTLKKMNERLKTARSNIRNARDGIQRVENHVYASEGKEGVVQQAVQGQCEVCDRPLLALWQALKGSLYTRQDGKITLTWVGLFLIVFWTWFITETVMCSLYCRPVFATYMEGFGVHSNAPEPPFVIPTVFFRPVRPLWRPLLNTITTFLHWLWDLVWYIFEETTPEYYKASSVLESVTEKVPSATSDTDWSMMNDEIL